MNEKLSIADRVDIRLHKGEQKLSANDFGSVLTVKGAVEARLFDGNGKLKEYRKAVPNMIVNNGKYGIADQLVDSPTLAKPTYMAIGTGTTAPAVTDTSLVTENCTRDALDSKTRSNNVITMVGTFAAGNGTGAVTEAGILNASTAGNLYSRVTFSAINKGANDTLQLTWTWTIG